MEHWRKGLAAAAVLLSCVPAAALPGLGGLRSSAAHSPGYPFRGQTVTFTVNASDADGIVDYVLICYGDGSCDAESFSRSANERLEACLLGSNFTQRFSHSYARAGMYPVTLSVRSVGCSWAPSEHQSSAYDLRVT